jgi:hypothetical protein
MSHDIAARLMAIANEAADGLRSSEERAAPARHWSYELLDPDGDAVLVDHAGEIFGRHVETVKGYAVEAANAGTPFGWLYSKAIWIFSVERLLAFILARHGRSKFLEAQSRADKMRKTRSASRSSVKNLSARTETSLDAGD